MACFVTTIGNQGCNREVNVSIEQAKEIMKKQQQRTEGRKGDEQQRRRFKNKSGKRNKP